MPNSVHLFTSILSTPIPYLEATLQTLAASKISASISLKQNKIASASATSLINSVLEKLLASIISILLSLRIFFQYLC